MHSMKGNAPFRMVNRLTSGVMPLMTNRFSPTGGVMRPSSMLIVSTTPNQMGSNPAAVMTGIRIGVVIRMMAAGGRKQPATSSSTLMSSMITHLSACMAPIAWATDCVT